MAEIVVPYPGAVVTREAALVAGAGRFFTGIPCKKAGHLAERRVVSWACVACEAERIARRYHKHGEAIRAAGKAHYQANKAKRLEQSREWYAANVERKAATGRAWRNRNLDLARELGCSYYRANREHVLALHKAWARANRHRKRAHYQTRRAKVRACEGFHTSDDIVALLVRQKHRCAMCDASIKKRYEVDHIQPLSKGGSNWPRNLQLLCRTCNRQKGHSDPLRFARLKGFLL